MINNRALIRAEEREMLRGDCLQSLCGVKSIVPTFFPHSLQQSTWGPQSAGTRGPHTTPMFLNALVREVSALKFLDLLTALNTQEILFSWLPWHHTSLLPTPELSTECQTQRVNCLLSTKFFIPTNDLKIELLIPISFASLPHLSKSHWVHSASPSSSSLYHWSLSTPTPKHIQVHQVHYNHAKPSHQATVTTTELPLKPLSFFVSL